MLYLHLLLVVPEDCHHSLIGHRPHGDQYHRRRRCLYLRFVGCGLWSWIADEVDGESYTQLCLRCLMCYFYR
jgi:hypothetical protein